MNELKVVKINDKLMTLLDRRVTFDMVFLDWSVMFRHGILGLECHIPTRYKWIGVSCLDTVLLDRSVTFRHGIIRS